MRVLVLGAGKIVSAILEGLYGKEDLSSFFIFSPSGKSAKDLACKVKAQWIQDLSGTDNYDQIWIGCKPQQLSSLATMLKSQILGPVFVSFLAAINENEQKRILGINHLIRVMPNLNVKFAKGVSLISSQSCKNDLILIKNIFDQLGSCLVVQESELDELTLLTGSGPAFFYEFAKCLAGSFSSLSIPERELLARLVLIGAAESLKNSVESFDDLISSVTSKGGVTIATLEHWRINGLNELLATGVNAGKQRSTEIAKSLHQT